MSQESKSTSQDFNEENFSDRDKTSKIERSGESNTELKDNRPNLENIKLQEVVEELHEIISFIGVQHFSGPLPPPSMLKEYENVLPGSAERLFLMTEKQANHRMSIEKTLVKGDIARSFAGLGAGFIIAMFGLGSSLYLGLQGKTWASGIMGVGTLGGLVSVFVVQNKKQEQSNSSEKESDS